jgi:peptidylprolyl isomerase
LRVVALSARNSIVRRLIALLLCLPLFLVACGGSDDASGNGGESSTTQGGGDLPTVKGKFGEKPTIDSPAGTAPTELKTEVLSEGDGEEVVKGDLLIANYQGQIWKDDKVFDNSFERGEPAGFGIGVGMVIPAWDKALVGKKLGSRVLMVVPPAEGYGEQGQEQAGIAGDDTLVFVVDLVDHFANSLAAKGTVATSLPKGLPAVTNEVGKKPVITLTKGAKAPAKPASATLIEGEGEAIDAAKNLVVQVVQADYTTGKTAYETWGQSPLGIKASQLPGLEEAIKGKKLGSRVLLTLPAQGQQPASVVVLDVVGTF